MAFEAITHIAQAEEASKVAVSYAEAQAKQMILDAENAGKTSVQSAIEKAEKELDLLKVKAEEQSAAKTEVLKNKLEKRKAELREAAEAKLGEAAKYVVERIVNG